MNYVVAMRVKHGIKILDTGKRYTQREAHIRARELNENCQEELMALNGISFVAYSLVIDEL